MFSFLTTPICLFSLKGHRQTIYLRYFALPKLEGEERGGGVKVEENKLKQHRGDFGLHIYIFPLYLVANKVMVTNELNFYSQSLIT